MNMWMTKVFCNWWKCQESWRICSKNYIKLSIIHGAFKTVQWIVVDVLQTRRNMWKRCRAFLLMTKNGDSAKFTPFFFKVMKKIKVSPSTSSLAVKLEFCWCYYKNLHIAYTLIKIIVKITLFFKTHKNKWIQIRLPEKEIKNCFDFHCTVHFLRKTNLRKWILWISVNHQCHRAAVQE